MRVDIGYYLLFMGMVSSAKIGCDLEAVSSMKYFNFSLFSGTWITSQGVNLGSSELRDVVKFRFENSNTTNNRTVSTLIALTPSDTTTSYKLSVINGEGDITLQTINGTDLRQVQLKAIDTDYETYSVVSSGKSILWVLTREKANTTFTKDNLSKALGDSCIDLVTIMYPSTTDIKVNVLKKKRRSESAKIILIVFVTFSALFLGFFVLLKIYKFGYRSI